MQELFYKLDERYVTFEQEDTLYADNDEKKVVFGVRVDRKAKNDSKYVAWYRENSRDYLYIVQTFVERKEDGELLFGGIRGEEGRDDAWSRWHSYDARKGIFYSLFLCVDQEGKISIRDSEAGSLQFFASAPNKKSFCYPRKDCYNYYFDRDSKQFAPDDEARNMRTLGVMSKNTRTGKWHLVNRLQTLPAGFYVSPAYSTLLEGSKKARGEKSTARDFASRDGQDTVNLPGNGMTDIYFIEFDEEGRMSQPNAPTRLVVVAGSAGNGKEERPTPMVDGKPGLAGGIVIYPKGNISRLRTTEQVIPN